MADMPRLALTTTETCAPPCSPAPSRPSARRAPPHCPCANWPATSASATPRPSRHFKDKQALLDALALAGFERLDEALAASRRRRARPSPTGSAGSPAPTWTSPSRNAELLDLMYARKHDPAASEALITAAQRLGAMAVELVAEGQRSGEVREGPVDDIAMPVFTTLHGFASFAVSGVLSAEQVGSGLDAVIAYMVRGCAPR